MARRQAIRSPGGDLAVVATVVPVLPGLAPRQWTIHGKTLAQRKAGESD